MQTGFTSGRFDPTNDLEVYSLSLYDAPAQTVWFSDRPNRVAGLVSTMDLIASLDFEDDPPDAALVIETEEGETVVIILELTSPLYDPVTAQIGFQARVLADELLTETALGFVE